MGTHALLPHKRAGILHAISVAKKIRNVWVSVPWVCKKHTAEKRNDGLRRRHLATHNRPERGGTGHQDRRSRRPPFYADALITVEIISIQWNSLRVVSTEAVLALCFFIGYHSNDYTTQEPLYFDTLPRARRTMQAKQTAVTRWQESKPSTVGLVRGIQKAITGLLEDAFAAGAASRDGEAEALRADAEILWRTLLKPARMLSIAAGMGRNPLRGPAVYEHLRAAQAHAVMPLIATVGRLKAALRMCRARVPRHCGESLEPWRFRGHRCGGEHMDSIRTVATPQAI